MSYSAISPHNQLPPTGCYTSDGKYQALPDNTAVRCQLMDFDGNFIKPDNTLGQQMVELPGFVTFVFISRTFYIWFHIKGMVTAQKRHFAKYDKQEIENILQG